MSDELLSVFLKAACIVALFLFLFWIGLGFTLFVSIFGGECSMWNDFLT